MVAVAYISICPFILFYFIFHRQNQVLQDGGIIRSVTMTSYMISLQKIELQGKGQ